MSRSVWKGPFVDGYLLKKAEISRESGRNDVIKTWSRRSTILPQFVGLTFGVHNGKKFIPVVISENMVGLKFGEFAPTRTYYGHTADNQDDSRDAPNSGEIAQINVFIKFADDPEFPFSRAYYDAVFQTDEDEPSLKHYFWEVSYNSLMVNTFHYPGTFDGSNTAYVDEYNRSYYMPYSNANPDGYQGATATTEWRPTTGTHQENHWF